MSNESRPKTVMNQGAPAARTTRSGKSGSNIRSAPRSSAPAREHGAKTLVVGLHLRHLAAPPRETLCRRRVFDGLPAPVPRIYGPALDHRMHLDTRLPLAMGGHDDLEAHQVLPKVRGGGREPEHRAAVHGSPAIRELHALVMDGTRDLPVGVPRTPLFHREQVREVGVQEQLDQAEGRLVAEVPDDDVLAHALTDVAGTEDHERGVRPARTRLDRETKVAEKGSSGNCGEGLGTAAVHPQLEAGEDPGVTDEQALGGARDHVAHRTADGEGRLVHQGDVPARLIDHRTCPGWSTGSLTEEDATGHGACPRPFRCD